MGVVNGKFLFNLKHSLKVIVMLGILMPPGAGGRTGHDEGRRTLDTSQPMTYNLWRRQPSVAFNGAAK